LSKFPRRLRAFKCIKVKLIFGLAVLSANAQSQYQYFLSKPKELTIFSTKLYAELVDSNYLDSVMKR
jgi:hypothetical protein